MPERVVIDTNVFVSAALKKTGISRAALDRAREEFTIVFTRRTFAELRRTRASRKFRAAIDVAARSLLLAALSDEAEFVSEPAPRARTRDPDDDKFLDLAWATGARYVITGDADVLAERIRAQPLPFAILTPGEFLRLLL